MAMRTLVIAAALLLIGFFQLGLKGRGVAESGGLRPVSVLAAEGLAGDVAGAALRGLVVAIPDQRLHGELGHGSSRLGIRGSIVLQGALALAQGGGPVVGADVFWLSKGKAPVATQTGQGGRFQFELQDGAVGELLAKKRGLQQARLALSPVALHGKGVALEMFEPATLVGHVALGAVPAIDVRILVVHSPGELRTVSVQADGSYRVDNLDRGGVIVRAFQGELASYMRAESPWISSATEPWPSMDVELVPGEVSEFDVTLAPRLLGSLVRELDLGLGSGIGSVVAVLSIRDTGAHGELHSQRCEAPVSTAGFAKFEWVGLEMGSYELVLTTGKAPMVVLHRESIEVDGERIKPPTLVLAVGCLKLELRCEDVGPWLVTIEQEGSAAIRFRTADRSFNICGVTLGRSTVTLSRGGKVISVGMQWVDANSPSRLLRLQ